MEVQYWRIRTCSIGSINSNPSSPNWMEWGGTGFIECIKMNPRRALPGTFDCRHLPRIFFSLFFCPSLSAAQNSNITQYAGIHLGGISPLIRRQARAQENPRKTTDYSSYCMSIVGYTEVHFSLLTSVSTPWLALLALCPCDTPMGRHSLALLSRTPL